MIDISRDVRYFPLLGQIETSGNYTSSDPIRNHTFNLLLNHKNQLLDRTVIENHLSPDEPMSDAAYKNLITGFEKKIGKEHIVSVSGMGIKLRLT